MASNAISYDFLQSPRDEFNKEMIGTVQRYKKDMENGKQDWDWFEYNSCKTHGRNCPSGSLEVTKSGTVNRLVYSQANLDSYIANQLKDFPENVKNEMKAAGTIQGAKFKEDFIKQYTVGGNIIRTRYLLAWYIDNTDKTITIFNFMCKIQRYAGNDHHFLAGYWDSNDKRIDKALSYQIGNLLKEKFPKIFLE